MTNVLIVEDDPMARTLFEIYLKNSGRYRMAAAIESASMAELYCLTRQVDLIIMDVCTALNSSGLDAAVKIKKNHPSIKIIIVTSQPECDFINRAREAGVDSFWYKDISPEALIDVIDRTMEGEHLFPDKTPKVKLGLADSTDLTAKEIKVLRLVCEGLGYSEIARELNIAERTVKYHISNILSKTGYANKTRLAIAVTNQKFIIPKFREEKE